MTRRPKRAAGRALIRAAAAGAGLLAAAVLAGCGSSAAGGSSPGGGSPAGAAATSAGTGTPAVSPSVTGSASPGPCATSALRLRVGPGQGAAGSFYFALEFRNTSGSACTLYGYPGVSFVTAVGGSQIGAAASRIPAAKRLVTLGPGQKAHATLRVTDVGVYPTSQCSVVTAHWLKVYPPNQFAAAYLKFRAQTCSGAKPVVLAVQPVQPGS
jgi:hypothetical protein